MASWLVDYMKVIDPASESPMQYNLWSGLSVLGSVLKGSIYVKYRTFTVYPNQYIVLVGPPGLGKGEAIHPAHALPKVKNLVNYISDRVTAPRIIEKLHTGVTGPPIMTNGQVIAGSKDSSATLMSTELPTLLTSSEWMLQFLCDSWDRGEYSYDTKHQGSYTVTGMVVSLMGACVPDYIRKLNRDSNATVSSGFSARTIFVNGKEKSKTLKWRDNIVDDPIYKHNMKTLADRLQTIAGLRGEVTLDSEAEALWDIYRANLVANLSLDDTDVYRNFKSRQEVHILKAAMILCAAEPNTNLVITKALLNGAIDLVEEVADGVDTIFSSVGESDLSAAIARLQLYIERKNLVSYNELVADNMKFINLDDIVRVIKILETISFITTTQAGTVFWYQHTGKPINPKRGTP